MLKRDISTTNILVASAGGMIGSGGCLALLSVRK